MATPTAPTLLPDATSLHLARLEAFPQYITAVVVASSPEADCPLCHARSEDIHSRYVRCVADLPWMGWAVRLELHVRRFFCRNQECRRQVFTERLSGVVAPYARRTTRLTDLLTLIGFADGVGKPENAWWRGWDSRQVHRRFCASFAPSLNRRWRRLGCLG